MSPFIRTAILPLCVAGLACSGPPRSDGGQGTAGAAGADTAADRAAAGIDSLNARLVSAYRSRDPQAYGALYTDTAVFEWPVAATVRGPAALAEMARSNWASLSDQDLRLIVAARRLGPEHATEFGAFEQSYRDAAGTRRTEFGRYVTVLARQADGSWRMDRFLGFADSTRPQSAPP